MSDQFFIPVADKTSSAFGNLQRSILGSARLRDERLQQEKQQMQSEQMNKVIGEFQTAFDANDYDTINKLSIQYPQIGQSTLDLLGAKNDRTRKNAVDTLFQLNSDPANFEKILGDREQLVLSEGGDPIDTQAFLNLYRENPEEAQKKARGYFAQVADQDTYDRYKELTSEKATEYTNVKKEPDGSYVGLNTKTNRIETIPGDYTRQPTEKPRKLKEVKGGVKYYEDGSEEPIGEGDSVKNPVTGKSFTPAQAQSVLADAKEFQLKNGGFAITLDSGLQTIDRMYEEGYDPTSAAWIRSAFGEGTLPTNLLTSDDDQVFTGATDQMINAIARRETGAAITDFERKDFFNRYMPKAGDSKKRIRQKRDALERQLKSIAGQSAGVFEALKVTGEDNAEPQVTSEVSESSGIPAQSFTSSGGIQFTVK